MKHRSFWTKNLLLIWLLVSSFSFLGGGKDDKKKPLFKLGERKYFQEEFEYYFLKNNKHPSADSIRYDVEEYLDLYIKFRLKVLEAENLGLDLHEDFKKEFEGYKKQLAKPYLTQSKMSEKLVLEAYERLKTEVRASHILLKLGEDALPQDTMAVFNRLMTIKERVEKGEDFESFAFEISEDPSAKKNKGDLGYFTALRMVYPFENAAYETDPGSTSNPVRTKFGYHLVHIKDRRSARGKMKAAHIMLRLDPMGKQDPQQVEKKIQSIYQKLLEGEDWNTLCKLHSEDMTSKNSGGELRWFGTGDLIKEFEDAAFAIDTVGGISKPVKTRFGWHIIKYIEKRPIAPLEKMRPELESRISRDSRSRETKQKAIESLKSKNGFNSDRKAIEWAFTAFDSSLFEGNWSLNEAKFNDARRLFSIGTKSFSSKDFWTYAADKQRRRKKTELTQYLEELYTQFERNKVLQYEEDQLESTNKDYRMLLEEYRSGILLFNLMEEKVWAKATRDTIGQQQFYNRHQSRYESPENARVRVFISASQEAIGRSRDYLTATKKEIDEAFNAKDPLHLQVVDKTVNKKEDPLIDDYWKEGTHEFTDGDLHYLLVVNKINPAGIRPLDEIKGLVISDYQEQLEQEWIKELKLKYPVKINKGAVNGFIKNIKDRI